jgi:hypothetical protein
MKGADTMKKFIATLAAASMLAASAAPSIAQSTPPASEPKPQTDPSPQMAPGANLSERLERSDGVIRPPADVDPEFHKTAPDTNTGMPVIPPPGSPGGRQDLDPK